MVFITFLSKLRECLILKDDIINCMQNIIAEFEIFLSVELFKFVDQKQEKKM